MRVESNQFLTHFKVVILTIILQCTLCASVYSQELPTSRIVKRQIEEIVEVDEGADGSFDYEHILAELDHYLDNPLDINRCDEEDILALGIFSSNDVRAIKKYVDEFGPVISKFEFQAIPGISLDEAKILAQICRIASSQNSDRPSVLKRLGGGENQLFLRYQRRLEMDDDYQPREDGSKRFEGDPNKYYLRLRHRYSNTLSFGVTAEKDPGEAFFRKSNPQGFDFYSAHLWWKGGTGDVIKEVALGDYAISFGEGLVMHSDFGYGKSGFIKDIKKNFRKLRPYTSITESNFLRGGAAVLSLGNRVELSPFVSFRKQDGNLVVGDTLDAEDDFFSSIQTSGFHRSVGEIADEGAVGVFTGGANIGYKYRGISFGFTAMTSYLDPGLQPSFRPDRIFTFQGSSLNNFGVHYSFFLGSSNFFGEVAAADPGGTAMVHGIMTSLHPKLDLGMFYRRYSTDYFSFWANGIAESSTTSNEEGIFLGLEYRPNYNFAFQGYVDMWKNPWLRFRVDAPAEGSEFFFRGTYKIKRKHEFYLRYRYETKYRTENVEGEGIDGVFKTERHQLRFNFDYTILPGLRLRNRVEFSFWNVEGIEKENGILLYQDVIYKPLGSSFSFTGRFALFDTDGWDSRIYAYENDLIYNFSIPAHSGRGTRYYLNTRYKFSKALTIEARIAQMRLPAVAGKIDGDLGREELETRTDFKAQLRYSF